MVARGGLAQARSSRPLAQGLGSEGTMQAIQVHDGKYLKILWEEEIRVIGIEWKASTVKPRCSRTWSVGISASYYVLANADKYVQEPARGGTPCKDLMCILE